VKGQAVDITRVFDRYAEDIRLVEEHLRHMYANEVPLIQVVSRHLLDSGGKRMRPLFLLVSARLAGYTGTDHIALAGIIESVHSASLLHDDVVDGADVRRGRPAAHALWSNQAVILVGDYLYSNALKQSVSFRNQDIMEALSAATTRMTQGELLQLEKLGSAEISEAEYEEIISAKTGALISAACRIGGILGGVSRQRQDALASFGLKVGQAFQMADDILDYMADEGDLGKSLGKDMEEGKVTLPVIYLLRAATAAERSEIAGILEGELTEQALGRMTELFRSYGTIEKAARRAEGLVKEAREALSAFPASQTRDDLFDMAQYALRRDR
jgi:octaprenyl-diphosphate synthase